MSYNPSTHNEELKSLPEEYIKWVKGPTGLPYPLLIYEGKDVAVSLLMAKAMFSRVRINGIETMDAPPTNAMGIPVIPLALFDQRKTLRKQMIESQKRAAGEMADPAPVPPPPPPAVAPAVAPAQHSEVPKKKKRTDDSRSPAATAQTPAPAPVPVPVPEHPPATPGATVRDPATPQQPCTAAAAARDAVAPAAAAAAGGDDDGVVPMSVSVRAPVKFDVSDAIVIRVFMEYLDSVRQSGEENYAQLVETAKRTAATWRPIPGSISDRWINVACMVVMAGTLQPIECQSALPADPVTAFYVASTTPVDYVEGIGCPVLPPTVVNMQEPHLVQLFEGLASDPDKYGPLVRKYADQFMAVSNMDELRELLVSQFGVLARIPFENHVVAALMSLLSLI